jgi:hypothetical protein
MEDWKLELGNEQPRRMAILQEENTEKNINLTDTSNFLESISFRRLQLP